MCRTSAHCDGATGEIAWLNLFCFPVAWSRSSVRAGSALTDSPSPPHRVCPIGKPRVGQFSGRVAPLRCCTSIEITTRINVTTRGQHASPAAPPRHATLGCEFMWHTGHLATNNTQIMTKREGQVYVCVCGWGMWCTCIHFRPHYFCFSLILGTSCPHPTPAPPPLECSRTSVFEGSARDSFPSLPVKFCATVSEIAGRVGTPDYCRPCCPTPS